MKQLTIIILLLLSYQVAMAQNVKEDIIAINAAYLAHSSLSMNVKYEVYKKQTDNKSFHVEEGTVWQKDQLKYQKIGPIETVVGDDFQLIVHHEEKQISLLGIQKGIKPDPKTPMGLPQLDKVLEQSEKTEFLEENATSNSYSFVPKHSEFEQIKIIYNKDNFFLQKIILDYKEDQDLEENGQLTKPRMVITCSNIDTNPSFSKESFSYNRFLVQQGDQLLCKPAFKAYELQNMLF